VKKGNLGFLPSNKKKIFFPFFFFLKKWGIFFLGGGGELVQSRRDNGWHTTQNFVWKCFLEIQPAACQYILSLINFIISNLANRLVCLHSVTAMSACLVHFVLASEYFNRLRSALTLVKNDNAKFIAAITKHLNTGCF